MRRLFSDVFSVLRQFTRRFIYRAEFGGFAKMKFGCFALIAFAAVIASPVTAAVVIDQDAFVAPPSGQPAFGWIASITGSRVLPGAQAPTNYILGQTVTAGLSGTLNSIELQYAPTVTGLQLRLYDGDALTNGGLFGGYSFSGTRFGATSISFDLSAFGYTVAPGRKFSFDLLFEMGPNATAAIGIGTFEGAVPPAPPPITKYVQYAGGTSFSFINGVPVVTSRDIAFRTTVDVAAPAVPEPASWAMMLVGFGLVGATIRRTTRRIATA
jgi:PEP-CTERM motif